jgi:hypothetical protein
MNKTLIIFMLFTTLAFVYVMIALSKMSKNVSKIEAFSEPVASKTVNVPTRLNTTDYGAVAGVAPKIANANPVPLAAQAPIILNANPVPNTIQTPIILNSAPNTVQPSATPIILNSAPNAVQPPATPIILNQTQPSATPIIVANATPNITTPVITPQIVLPPNATSPNPTSDPNAPKILNVAQPTIPFIRTPDMAQTNILSTMPNGLQFATPVAPTSSVLRPTTTIVSAEPIVRSRQTTQPNPNLPIADDEDRRFWIGNVLYNMLPNNGMAKFMNEVKSLSDKFRYDTYGTILQNLRDYVALKIRRDENVMHDLAKMVSDLKNNTDNSRGRFGVYRPSWENGAAWAGYMPNNSSMAGGYDPQHVPNTYRGNGFVFPADHVEMFDQDEKEKLPGARSYMREYSMHDSWASGS